MPCCCCHIAADSGSTRRQPSVAALSARFACRPPTRQIPSYRTPCCCPHVQAPLSSPADDMHGHLRYIVEVSGLQINSEAEAAQGRLLLAARSGRLRGLHIADVAVNVTALLMEQARGIAAVCCCCLMSAGGGARAVVASHLLSAQQFSQRPPCLAALLLVCHACPAPPVLPCPLSAGVCLCHPDRCGPRCACAVAGAHPWGLPGAPGARHGARQVRLPAAFKRTFAGSWGLAAVGSHPTRPLIVCAGSFYSLPSASSLLRHCLFCWVPSLALLLQARV